MNRIVKYIRKATIKEKITNFLLVIFALFVFLYAASPYTGKEVFNRNKKSSLKNSPTKCLSVTPTKQQKSPTQVEPTPIVTTGKNSNSSHQTSEKKSEEKISAKKVDEDVYEITRNFADEKMGTSQETYEALNRYRQQNGRATLAWDNNLANYAQQRANYYASIGTTDAHAGFAEFLNTPDFGAYKQLGFGTLGESSAYLNQGPLSGENIIFKFFKADPEHNTQQLDPDYTHVGISIVGVAVEIVFGGAKI